MSMRQLRITNSITNRETPSLEKYLQEIRRVELVSPEEEVRLANLIRQGDRDAIEQLINANLRFVVSVAKQYQHQGLPLSDLINEGNLGLIRAAERFDDTKGFKFISYAVWWIRQAIVQALSEHGRMVRLPLNKVGLGKRIQRAYNQLEQEMEREPSVEELADTLKMEVRDIMDIQTLDSRTASVDAPLDEGEENTLLDILENPNAEKADKKLAYTKSLHTEIERSLQRLSGPQRTVICYFFGLGIDRPLTLEAIADKCNLSRERIRQIKDKAMEKLSTGENVELLRSFLWFF